MNIIVTGATGAIGQALTKALLMQGHCVIMACRNLSKAESIKTNLLKELKVASEKVIISQLDLAISDSIIQFRNDLIEKELKIDGLINNAGVLQRHFEKTVDGYENTIAVNFLKPVELIHKLKPLLAPHATIVNVNSRAKHPRYLSKSLFGANEKEFSQLRSYLSSKTALTVYTATFSQKMKGVFRVNLADPGVVNTELIRLDRWFDLIADLVFRPFTKTPEKSTIPIINALFSDKTGMQFYSKKQKPIAKKYTKHTLNRWLWEETNNRIKK